MNENAFFNARKKIIDAQAKGVINSVDGRIGVVRQGAKSKITRNHRPGFAYSRLPATNIHASFHHSA